MGNRNVTPYRRNPVEVDITSLMLKQASLLGIQARTHLTKV
ncbi:hypothetical protein O9929_24820 [Vibrio lentus]|nr:hypothetical protein [Vibrio lentus]